MRPRERARARTHTHTHTHAYLYLYIHTRAQADTQTWSLKRLGRGVKKINVRITSTGTDALHEFVYLLHGTTIVIIRPPSRWSADGRTHVKLIVMFKCPEDTDYDLAYTERMLINHPQTRMTLDLFIPIQRLQLGTSCTCL